MKATIKGPMLLETKTKAGQSRFVAVHEGHRAQVNRIDVALLTVTNRARPLAFVAFSAAS